MLVFLFFPTREVYKHVRHVIICHFLHILSTIFQRSREKNARKKGKFHLNVTFSRDKLHRVKPFCWNEWKQKDLVISRAVYVTFSCYDNLLLKSHHFLPPPPRRSLGSPNLIIVRAQILLHPNIHSTILVYIRGNTFRINLISPPVSKGIRDTFQQTMFVSSYVKWYAKWESKPAKNCEKIVWNVRFFGRNGEKKRTKNEKSP